MCALETAPTLTTARLVLRALKDGDAAALFAVHSNAEVMRYWSRAPMTDLKEAVERLATIADGARAGTARTWGVTRHGSEQVIGTVSVWKLDLDNRRAELGYILAREHWGHGLMLEALGTVIEHAFGTLALHRLEADTDPRNAASVVTLERLGFRREGLLRERWIVAGEVSDTALYGLLASEWRERSARRE